VTNRHDLPISTGPDDPRLHEIDEDFRQALADLELLTAAARVFKRRTFHGKGATGARGTAELLPELDLPEHDFFTPGRRFDVVARYSNSQESDDIAPAIRGVSLRPARTGRSPA